MPTANLKFVEAYRAAHAIQAHALRLALEEAGIRPWARSASLGRKKGPSRFCESGPKSVVDGVLSA